MARPASGKAPKKGKRNRKWNRNRAFCLRYRNEGRQEKNRARRINRHLKRFPNDDSARKALYD